MVISSDFFIQAASDFFEPIEREELDRARLSRLIDGPEAETADTELALALMDLVRDDLALSGTTGGQLLSDDEMRVAVRALERVSARAGHEFKLPFRDHTSWRGWWIRNGAQGNWQARRDLLSDLFDGPYAKIMAAHDKALDSTLVETVTPHDGLGWPQVDTEVGELRRHFRTASTPQDYRAVGNDCVHITEALSRQVYSHDKHRPDDAPSDEPEPPVQNTKTRLDRYITASLPGSDNAAMRKFARASIELAQAVKHSGAPTRTEAGILADAVISLANMLRRIGEDEESAT